MTEIPSATWSGSFKLFGVDVKCHVLDNGQRIIEEASMVELLEAMGDPETTLDPGDMTEFARWQQGRR